MIKVWTIIRCQLQKFIYTGLFGCLLLSPVFAVAAEDFEIRLEEGQVWLESDQADLAQLLDTLSVAGRFKLWISDEFASQPVTLTISDQSMTETLRRLLEGHAHALVHNDNAVVTSLFVMHTGQLQDESELPSPGDDEQRRQSLQEVLEATLLPEDARAQILNQLITTTQSGPEPTIIEQSPELQQIIEQLNQIGLGVSPPVSPVIETLQKKQGKE